MSHVTHTHTHAYTHTHTHTHTHEKVGHDSFSCVTSLICTHTHTHTHTHRRSHSAGTEGQRATAARRQENTNCRANESSPRVHRIGSVAVCVAVYVAVCVAVCESIESGQSFSTGGERVEKEAKAFFASFAYCTGLFCVYR